MGRGCLTAEDASVLLPFAMRFAGEFKLISSDGLTWEARAIRLVMLGREARTGQGRISYGEAIVIIRTSLEVMTASLASVGTHGLFILLVVTA